MAAATLSHGWQIWRAAYRRIGVFRLEKPYPIFCSCFPNVLPDEGYPFVQFSLPLNYFSAFLQLASAFFCQSLLPLNHLFIFSTCPSAFFVMPLASQPFAPFLQLVLRLFLPCRFAFPTMRRALFFACSTALIFITNQHTASMKNAKAGACCAKN